MLFLILLFGLKTCFQFVNTGFCERASENCLNCISFYKLKSGLNQIRIKWTNWFTTPCLIRPAGMTQREMESWLQNLENPLFGNLWQFMVYQLKVIGTLRTLLSFSRFQREKYSGDSQEAQENHQQSEMSF